MASNYTWTEVKLYDKDGIQIFLARANENAVKKAWHKVENGIRIKITHEEAAVYIDPEYKQRIEKRRQRKETIRKNRGNSTYKMAAFEYSMPWA